MFDDAVDFLVLDLLSLSSEDSVIGLEPRFCTPGVTRMIEKGVDKIAGPTVAKSKLALITLAVLVLPSHYEPFDEVRSQRLSFLLRRPVGIVQGSPITALVVRLTTDAFA
jgi:hypothetical protein